MMRDTGVCETNTPPEKKTLGKTSLQSAKSGAGEQFLPLDCRANAHIKGVVFHRRQCRCFTGLVPAHSYEVANFMCCRLALPRLNDDVRPGTGASAAASIKQWAPRRGISKYQINLTLKIILNIYYSS